MGQKTMLSRFYGGMTAAMGRPAMRPVTRAFSGLHAAMFRLTGGRARNPRWPMLVLAVTGPQDGEIHGCSAGYVKDNGRFVIAAAYGRSDENPAWWLNLQANPDA